MCRSMVDIQSPTAEIRRGKKRKILQDEKIYMVSLLHRATINNAMLIIKRPSASGGLRPPDPLPGFRPWRLDPIGDFRPRPLSVKYIPEIKLLDCATEKTGVKVLQKLNQFCELNNKF